MWLRRGGNTSTPLIKCDSENIKPRAVNQGKQLWLFYKNFNGHQRLSFNYFFPPGNKFIFLAEYFSAVCLTLSVFLYKCPRPFNPLPAPTSYQSTIVFLSKLLHVLICRDLLPVCMSQKKEEVIDTLVTRHWIGILLLLAPINVSSLKLQSLRYLSWWRNPLDGNVLVVTIGVF